MDNMDDINVFKKLKNILMIDNDDKRGSNPLVANFKRKRYIDPVELKIININRRKYIETYQLRLRGDN